MQVGACSGHRAMTKRLLQHVDGATVVEAMTSMSMSEPMAGNFLVDARSLGSLHDNSPNLGCIQVALLATAENRSIGVSILVQKL